MLGDDADRCRGSEDRAECLGGGSGAVNFGGQADFESNNDQKGVCWVGLKERTGRQCCKGGTV